MKTVLNLQMLVMVVAVLVAGRTAGAFCPNSPLKKMSAEATEMTTALKDLRQPIDRRTNPQLDAVGIFVQDSKLAGSGFLVDSCHVVTNAHVAYAELAHIGNARSGTPVDPTTLQLDDHKRMEFRVGVSDENPKSFKHVLGGQVVAHGLPNGSREESEQDWAVIKLDRSMPQSFPVIPIAQIPKRRAADLPVVGVGYPADRTNRGTDFSYLYGDLDCKISSISLEGFYIHNCQLTGGQSGGSLLVSQSGILKAVGMFTGTDPSLTGLEKAQPLEKAQVGVSFAPGAPGYPSEGDKILTAISSSPCN